MGEVFLMDVASNLRVWERDPRPQVPSDSGQRGRPCRRARASRSGVKAEKVETLTARVFASEARKVAIRDADKGALSARVWVRNVWVWDGKSTDARRRLLIVREEADGTFKYSLSNAPADTSWERLAYMQAQRFWIERCFQDAKNELGMAQYELRGWTGWHHHMALVCLALLFLLKERHRAKASIPLLSARDIVELLAVYLPRRPRRRNRSLAPDSTPPRRAATRHRPPAPPRPPPSEKTRHPKANKVELV
jgi:SRSO17 transposase